MISAPNPLLVLLVKSAIIMFEFISDILRYIRLKGFVSFFRFGLWWKAGYPKASPNSILFIPSRNAGRTIKAHVYQPPMNLTKRNPVLINFHGSGFVFPFHGADDKFCRKVSSETGHTVLDIQYRLAPENPYPAAVHDAEDVIRWVQSHPELYDLTKISLSGFSAGANLALVQSGMNFPKDTFRSILCFYPPTDLATAPEEKLATTPDPSGKPIPPSMSKIFDACYVPRGASTRNPRISPLFAPVDNFPQNFLMITCACDSLCLEAEAVSSKIEEVGGRNLVTRRMEKCDHGWDKRVKPGSVQEKARDEAYDLASQMLNL